MLLLKYYEKYTPCNIFEQPLQKENNEIGIFGIIF